MAGKDNAIEFTEAKYCSRREIGNELGISVPEDMWNKIQNYRRSFYNSLSLKDVEGKDLFVCLYPTLANKINQIEAKVSRIAEDYARLDELNGDKQHFKFACLSDALKTLAIYHNIDIDTARIKKLITSENPFDEGEEKLLNYFYALMHIESNHEINIDVDFLADLYSKVTGINELTYFYRSSNINDISSIALVSRVYTSAPSEKIEPMMESLFSYLKESKNSALVKALVSYYYVSYIKPFKDYNEEIAILIAKAVLAHFAYGECGAYLPLENLLNMKSDLLRKMNQDVLNTADVTYFVSPHAFRADHDIDDMKDVLKDYSLNTIRNDFYKLDEEPVKEEIIEEKVVVEEKKEEPQPKVEEPVVEEKKEEIKPVESSPVKEEVEETVELPSPGLAVNYIPIKIDEKEAARLEEHLLEMDYRLKKGEAKFYARHCSLGMYYTIEQYKKCVKCVYETARTSMDHLAELGYYNKTKVGKKFVYTPVKRK